MKPVDRIRIARTGVIDVGRGQDGKRRQHTEVVRGTRKEAKRRERELLSSRETGRFVKPHRLTVAEYMAMWLESIRTKVEPNTHRGYEQRSRTHIVPDLGRVKLTDLSALLIEQTEALWLLQGNRRTGGPLDPQTVLHAHRVLHAAMERAVSWRLVPVNPVDGVEPPHVSSKERDFLTADESERLVAGLVGQDYELPILVALYCGLRPTEYLALRWRDVDLDAGRAARHAERPPHPAGRGNRAHGPAGGRLPVRTGENAPLEAARLDAGRRGGTAPRTSEAAGRDAAASCRSMDGPEPRVHRPAGYPHNHDRVRRAFYKGLDAAGVRQVVLHALRHTMATLALHETKDLKLVATRLGHSNEMLCCERTGIFCQAWTGRRPTV
jgi:integrase